MKIKSIHIYSHDGQRRDLNFKLGLNVITGRSSTGKSAISEIIEYCMGQSDFNVPEGIIRDKVAWFAVIYQFNGEQILIAKPTPKIGCASCSTVMLQRGGIVQAPLFNQLAVNTDDDTIVTLLSRLLGITENRTDVALENSRNSYATNIKHTLYYLFQKQGFVANKDQLLYRQNEPFQPQAIRDTFPILLGVSSNVRFELESKLRVIQRDLKLNVKRLEQVQGVIDIEHLKVLALYSEAKAVGIIGNTAEELKSEEMINVLKSSLDWTPQLAIDDDSSRISQLEDELTKLRKDRREVQSRIDATQQFFMRENGYQNEAIEQQHRLSTIKAFPKDPYTGEWQWPFTEPNLALNSPIATILLKELSSLDNELKITVNQRPKLESHLQSLEVTKEEIKNLIKKREIELFAAISANEVMTMMSSRNNAAARVLGRISMFLENLTSDEEVGRLELENRRLKLKIESLEAQIGKDDGNDRLLSILNNISAQATRYIQKFEAEFQEFPARLDLKHMTICFDRPDRSVPMSRTGGGANHLAYHLSALLALHLFSVKNKRPIPQFLFIDQPTQVYFPSEKAYKEADGSIAKTEEDADITAVRRLFELLLNFTKIEAPGFQIIVVEHANLREQWFQDALVEQPWSKPPALVPEEWPLR